MQLINEKGEVLNYPDTEIEVIKEAQIMEAVSMLKIERRQAVKQIVVTITSGETLDGDEVSQSRMARAISALPDDTTTVSWTGANNDVYSLTKPQLQEALLLAGQAQTQIWAEYAVKKAEVIAAIEAQ